MHIRAKSCADVYLGALLAVKSVKLQIDGWEEKVLTRTTLQSDPPIDGVVQRPTPGHQR